MQDYEALAYVERWDAVVSEFQAFDPALEARLDRLLDLVVASFPPATWPAVVFESADGDGFGRYVSQALSDRGFPPRVACLWLDKKIVSLPLPSLVVSVVGTYEEHLDFGVDQIVLVCSAMDPEVVAALVHRTLDRNPSASLTVLSLVSSVDREDVLRDLLPPRTAGTMQIISASYEIYLEGPSRLLHGGGRSTRMQQVRPHLAIPRFVAARIGA
jgi:hypothetical protein